MAFNPNIRDLSESFLHFLDDNNSKKYPPTLCQSNSNIYHDSDYTWCKVCNKIFCGRCSMSHLLNNQIDHSNSRDFLKKEYLDIEYNNDVEKLEVLQKYTEDFFTRKNKIYSEPQKQILNDIIKKFDDLKTELINAIDNFRNKIINTALENMNKISKNYDSNLLNENNVKKDIKDIYNRFINIQNKYTKCQDFAPTQIKPYYDELLAAHKLYYNLNMELVNMDKGKEQFSKEVESKFDYIKALINNANNNIKTYCSNFQKFVKEIKV